MSTPTIHVTIVDSAGERQSFRAGHVDLDWGCGSIDLRPGKPAFCRGFHEGVMTLDDGISVKTLNLINGMAALTGDAVHVVCERATLGRRDWGEHPIAPARCLHEGTTSKSQASSCNEGSPPPGQTLSPNGNKFPAQPTEATTNKKH
jgi:hypothetical protein